MTTTAIFNQRTWVSLSGPAFSVWDMHAAK